MNSNAERRTSKRVAANVPVGVRSGGKEAPEISAETRDISTNGVFFYTDSAMAEGSKVDLVLILPPEFTAGERSWVCCHGQILRVEQGKGMQFGVAASIERIDVLPEIPI
jgi:hypothetical protein